MVTGPGSEARDALARAAAAAAEDLLAHVPDTGDPATGPSVDAFVDEAAAALRRLAGALAAARAPRSAR